MYSLQERLGLQTEPINSSIWQWACMLRCAVPGIVISFDPVKQTCEVQVAIQERVLLPPPPTETQPNPTAATRIPTNVTIDTLKDVPIIFPHVNGWSMTMPITAGTECLLIFADMCIDGWWDTGKVLPQYDRRRHDLSDAFALFGPWSQPFNVPNYSTDWVQIRSDDLETNISLTHGGIVIQSAVVTITSSGGGIPLVTSNLYDWVLNDLLPALSAKGITVAPPPTTSVCTTVKGE